MTMTAANHTEHYELSQYTEGDHPTYTGDYNGDMAKIDAAIHAASQSGGLASVTHTNDLTGDGSDGNPLGVADTIARTEDIPSLDEYATTESVTQAIAAAIADRLTAGDVKPGNDINISASGNQVTISYVGNGLSTVAHDNTLTGDGTKNTPLGIRSRTVVNLTDNRWNAINFNDFYANGIYTFNGDPTNGPNDKWVTGALIVLRSYELVMQLCLFQPPSSGKNVAYRQCRVSGYDGRPSDDGVGAVETYCVRDASTIMVSSGLSNKIIVKEVS